MRHRQVHYWLLTICLLALSSLPLPADEYTVMFNCWNRDGANGCRQVFGVVHPGVDSEVFEWYRWASYGHADGSRIPNLSGEAIRAIHLKINGTNDTFRVPPAAGGKLFENVWRKKDGKEVLFNVVEGGMGIAPGSRFWSLVNPRTPGFPAGYFLGKAFKDRQPDPDPADWDRIVATFPLARFPDHYRDIRASAETADGGTIIVSDDDVLWLNRNATELKAVRLPQTIPAGANRITREAGQSGADEEIILWKDSVQILKLSMKTMKLWPKNLLTTIEPRKK